MGCRTCFTVFEPVLMTHARSNEKHTAVAGVHTIEANMHMSVLTYSQGVDVSNLPTTINVNSNPLLTDFRYTWLGRLAKPT